MVSNTEPFGEGEKKIYLHFNPFGTFAHTNVLSLAQLVKNKNVH